ncbi:unnamed protein product [Cuscuta epithymum]|uniref:Uncharacterized protein n=2 Tax=Cuscuta epithymum TaxID=186058 RepID=A0AAV0D276_9ASTE|nr:unnamed protein product [Cuscuta epithymum]
MLEHCQVWEVRLVGLSFIIMEKIAEEYGKMSIEEEENSGLVFESGALNVNSGVGENPHFSVVARVITDKHVCLISFRETMAMIRRPSKGVSIEQIGDMRFMIQFFHESNVSRVLQDDPLVF